MATENTTESIFSGLKVVDFASFIAGPSAAVILSDFGAEVIKVEPPSGDLWRHGNEIPPQPQSKIPYQFHLANRNKRGMALDLKSPSSQPVLERLVKWADVLIVNTPHPARRRLKLEYEDVVQWNPRLIYADVTGFGEKGPDAALPGFDITAYWARSGLLSLTREAGEPPTWPVAGSGDNATAVGLYSAIVTALYRRERTGKGAHVSTALLAEGIWSASVSIQAALSGAKFYGPFDRKSPANAALNVYQASDGTWFVLIITPDKLEAVAEAIGRTDLLTDPRFSDPGRLMANMSQLTAILDEVFGAHPMAHWHDVFGGVHVTFGAVRGPDEVINDPQLRANDIVVPLDGAGHVQSTISSPMQVHDAEKVPARRAQNLANTMKRFSRS
jgi:crotonobetainyl-CoA:carnitine CoA-transferase CaiB-like acyl-CoA transferase